MTYRICSSHVMKIGLIPWSRKYSSKQSDLTMDVRGQSLGMVGKDEIWFNSETFGILLEAFSFSIEDLAKALKGQNISGGGG